MTPAQSSQAHEHPHPVYTNDDIDLRQLARAVWRYRVAILVSALLGAVAGIGVSLLSTKYVSQGLFLTPNLTLGGYKQYEATLSNEPRLRQFIDLHGIKGTHTAELLHELVETPEAMAAAVLPMFAVTAKDAKDFGVKPDELGGLVGVQLKLERGAKGEDAPVMALAEYLRSTAIKVDLKDAILTQCMQFQTREQELRNEQLQSEFDIRQQQDRAESLRKLIAATPGAAMIDSRQVVSLENGGERFLSPTAQLVATEVIISDMQLAAVKRERERVAAGLRKDYYCKAHEAFEQPATGRHYLEQLEGIQTSVFEGQDMSVGIVEQTANEMGIQRHGWQSQYLEKMRFVVPPEGAELKVRNPGLTMGLLLGSVLGGLLGVFLALLLAWWHDNSMAVMETD